VGKGVVRDFIVRANSDCWEWDSLQGNARSTRSSVSVGGFVQHFEQGCEFHTQSVALSFSSKLLVVVGQLPSIVCRCLDFPWPDRHRLIDVEVLERTCVDLKDRRD